ncbi:hypothetical protein ADL26_08235, partial [Thermoactinomyces vulgaris]
QDVASTHLRVRRGEADAEEIVRASGLHLGGRAGVAGAQRRVRPLDLWFREAGSGHVEHDRVWGLFEEAEQSAGEQVAAQVFECERGFVAFRGFAPVRAEIPGAQDERVDRIALCVEFGDQSPVLRDQAEVGGQERGTEGGERRAFGFVAADDGDRVTSG